MCLARFVLTPIAAIALALGTLESPPVSAAAAGGNWPQWRGPLRDGVSTETGLLPSWPKGGPPKVWSISGLGRGFSGVSVTGGRIYTMGDLRDGQYVIALDEETGKQVWATRIGKVYDSPDDFNGPRGSPPVDGAMLYVVNTDGAIVALDTAGKERWRKSFPADFGGQMMSRSFALAIRSGVSAYQPPSSHRRAAAPAGSRRISVTRSRSASERLA